MVKIINVSPSDNFEDILEVKKKRILDDIDVLPWRYGGYKIFQYVKRFFCNKPLPQKELNLEDVVRNLISPFAEEPSMPIPDETLNKCQELLRHQRTLEDTRARRRLERWATSVIGLYLTLVFCLIVANGVVLMNTPIDTIELIGKSNTIVKRGFISDSVMSVILTTTTINIIGLGVIVLKGHFNQKQKDKKKDKKSKTESE